MKKIIVSILTIVISLITIFNFSIDLHADCKFNSSSGADVTKMVEGCLEWSWVVEVDWVATIEGAFKDKINKWTNNIALFLGLLAIGSVIYGWLMMTLSAWEDEKITKAKDIVKWSLLGLLGVILATTIVTLVIKLIYWLGETVVK
jgi:hypothetical protein